MGKEQQAADRAEGRVKGSLFKMFSLWKTKGPLWTFRSKPQTNFSLDVSVKLISSNVVKYEFVISYIIIANIMPFAMKKTFRIQCHRKDLYFFQRGHL